MHLLTNLSLIALLPLLTSNFPLTSAQTLPNPAAAQAYAPRTIPCPPDFQLIRTPNLTTTTNASSILSPDELAYTQTRATNVLPGAWQAYLANVLMFSSSQNVTLPAYVAGILNSSSAAFASPLTSNSTSSSNGAGAILPVLGLAMSGGGLRASIFGAGILNAIDSRINTSASSGLGGLFQSATYLAGLSGGSWLVTSFAQADFPTIPELVFGPSTDDTDSSSTTTTNAPGNGTATPEFVPQSGGVAVDDDDGPGGVDNGGFGGWITQIDFFQVSTNPETVLGFAADVISEVGLKVEAGFPVTINDVWARFLARHFTNGTTAANFLSTNVTHGAGVLFSDIANVSSILSHAVPLPIVVSDSRPPLSTIDPAEVIPGDLVPIDGVAYEFTPYEFGSFDPQLSSFVPIKFLGTTPSSMLKHTVNITTNGSNGTNAAGNGTQECVVGFDQAAFVLGASSELFNAQNTTLQAFLNSTIGQIIAALNQSIPQPQGIELDVALIPNPFTSVSPPSPSSFNLTSLNSTSNPSISAPTFEETGQSFLSLVDGGEDGQVIPIQPLLVEARGVDVIIAVDATNDEGGYAFGSSLIATQNKSLDIPQYHFPAVPTNITTFMAQNLTSRPTFFGCNDTSPTPLVIYIANGAPPRSQPTSFLTNTSTDQTQYNTSQVQGMLAQIEVIATQGLRADGGEGADEEWPACVACAVVDRVRAAEGTERSGVCASCFERYCWFEDASVSVNGAGRLREVGVMYLGTLSVVTAVVMVMGTVGVL